MTQAFNVCVECMVDFENFVQLVTLKELKLQCIQADVTNSTRIII